MPITPISDWMMALEPIGWTINLILSSLGMADIFQLFFYVKDKDHVAFDIPLSGCTAKDKENHGGFWVFSDYWGNGLCFFPTWQSIFDNRLMTLKKIQNPSYACDR